jgi:hypothetical protein
VLWAVTSNGTTHAICFLTLIKTKSFVYGLIVKRSLFKIIQALPIKRNTISIRQHFSNSVSISVL